MRYLCCQYHIDFVLGPQKPLVEGALRALEVRLALISGVRWKNERVGAMFKHLGLEAFGETICCPEELAEHCVALPPPHQVDGVWVH